MKFLAINDILFFEDFEFFFFKGNFGADGARTQ